MQCEEWADANSELFKEAHDETVHKNSYKRKLYELIGASLEASIPGFFPGTVKLWNLCSRSWEDPITFNL